MDEAGTPSELAAYAASFYEGERRSSVASAQRIVPMVMEVLTPRSVVDIGCGVGAFLQEFERAGVPEIQGIEGDWIRPELLLIPAEKVQVQNLTRPIDLPRTFDLAVCLEVGEHLGSRFATSLVESLVKLAPAVLFSAAIPYQGGTHHVNERFPEYWARRFRRRGYVPFDAFRDRLLPMRDVAAPYAQNMILYADRTRLPPASSRSPALSPAPGRVPIKLRGLRNRPGEIRWLMSLPPLLREWVYYTSHATLGKRAPF